MEQARAWDKENLPSSGKYIQGTNLCSHTKRDALCLGLSNRTTVCSRLDDGMLLTNTRSEARKGEYIHCTSEAYKHERHMYTFL